MPTGVSSNSERPQCPRCGYDQTGLIESWKDSCPLLATCAECGYGFDPADALDPTRKRLPWLHEHAKHWWSVRSAIKTLLMLLWPPVFWKRVRPEHEVRVGRVVGLLLWPYALLAMGFLVLFFAEHITAGRVWMWRRPTPLPWGQSISDGFKSFGVSLVDGRALGSLAERLALDVSLFLLAIFWLPVAGAFLAVPSEWSGSRLTRKHLIRLLGYAAIPLGLASIVAGVWALGLGSYQLVYYMQSPQAQQVWARPWQISSPDWLAPIALGLLLLVWSPLYWFSAIRWGYSLPSTRRPFLIVLAVLLTPWALFLAFSGYYWLFA
jgi:hypothetical protein